MLRHYDRIGLVSPTYRSAGGYREYSPQDVTRLFQVESLRLLGLSLSQITEVLADLEFDPTTMVAELIARTRQRLRQESELLDRLTTIEASGAGAWADVLRTISLIRGLHAADPSTRLRAALSHGGESPADAATLVEAALDEPDPQVAGALHWALARSGDHALPTLAQALDATDAQRRHAAVAALGKIGSPQAMAVLAGAHDHPDPLVAARATLARGRLGLPDAIAGLVALVVTGRDDVEAAETLGQLARDEANRHQIVALVEQELSRADTDARQRLTTALAEIPGTPADSILAMLATDAEPGVSSAARFVLSRRQDQESC